MNSKPLSKYFPDRIRALEPYDGAFDAYRLAAEGCEVLFASYPAGSTVPSHVHVTENIGVVTLGALFLETDGNETRFGPGEWYHLDANQTHAARFETDTAIIEFWFSPAD